MPDQRDHQRTTHLSSLSLFLDCFVLNLRAQRLSSLASLAESKSRNGTQSLYLEEQAIPVAAVIPTTALSSTHLCLHSRVPLGY
ncbi:hypothetical protein KSS87_011604 [Heliosperma pusillum]|nr:hypothetical protein KSS87_011604 [Heliosperma pusillum]